VRTAAPPGPHAGGASAKASAGRRGAGQCPLPVVPGDAASTAEQHTDSSAQRAALCAAMRMPEWRPSVTARIPWRLVTVLRPNSAWSGRSPTS